MMTTNSLKLSCLLVGMLICFKTQTVFASTICSQVKSNNITTTINCTTAFAVLSTKSTSSTLNLVTATHEPALTQTSTATIAPFTSTIQENITPMEPLTSETSIIQVVTTTQAIILPKTLYNNSSTTGAMVSTKSTIQSISAIQVVPTSIAITESGTSISQSVAPTVVVAASVKLTIRTTAAIQAVATSTTGIALATTIQVSPTTKVVSRLPTSTIHNNTTASANKILGTSIQATVTSFAPVAPGTSSIYAITTAVRGIAADTSSMSVVASSTNRTTKVIKDVATFTSVMSSSVSNIRHATIRSVAPVTSSIYNITTVPVMSSVQKVAASTEIMALPTSAIQNITTSIRETPVQKMSTKQDIRASVESIASQISINRTIVSLSVSDTSHTASLAPTAASSITTPHPTKHPSSNYPRNLQFSFKENCSDFYNSSTEKAFKEYLIKKIALHIDINVNNMPNFNVKCGSIIVTFTLTPYTRDAAPSVNDTIERIRDLIDSGKLVITLPDGRNLTANRKSLEILPQTTKAPVTSLGTTPPTVKPMKVKTASNADDRGLSHGAIAGICFGCILLLILTLIALYVFYYRKNGRQNTVSDVEYNELQPTSGVKTNLTNNAEES